MTRSSRLSSRRAFLRAAGVAGAGLALPPLEAQAQPLRPPTRFFCFFMPNGTHLPLWIPKTTGSGWAVTPALAPLARVRERVTVVSGAWPRIRYNALNTKEIDVGAHSVLSVLTGNVVLTPRGPAGPSIDQVVARELGRGLRIPALYLLADEHPITQFDRRILSWSAAETPVDPIRQPREAFDALVGLGAQPGAGTARRRSILDFVSIDLRRLQARTGVADRRRLDEYATAVREIEQRIQALEKAPTCAAPGPRPEVIPMSTPQELGRVDQPAVAQALLDLAILALRCNASQAVVYQRGIAGGGSFQQYGFLFTGPKTGSYNHHKVSHDRTPEGIERHVRISQHALEQFLKVFDALDRTPEGGGTMLDNTLLYFTSECGEGNNHGYDLPLVLAGRAGGRLRLGEHIKLQMNDPRSHIRTCCSH